MPEFLTRYKDPMSNEEKKNEDDGRLPHRSGGGQAKASEKRLGEDSTTKYILVTNNAAN